MVPWSPSNISKFHFPLIVDAHFIHVGPARILVSQLCIYISVVAMMHCSHMVPLGNRLFRRCFFGIYYKTGLFSGDFWHFSQVSSLMILGYMIIVVMIHDYMFSDGFEIICIS